METMLGVMADNPAAAVAGLIGKYPPAKPGALGFEPLKAVGGSLTRPLMFGAA